MTIVTLYTVSFVGPDRTVRFTNVTLEEFNTWVGQGYARRGNVIIWAGGVWEAIAINPPPPT